MVIGLTVILLLASADAADEGCRSFCADVPDQRVVAKAEITPPEAECGTMTLQFKVGSKTREKQQKTCEIRVQRRQSLCGRGNQSFCRIPSPSS